MSECVGIDSFWGRAMPKAYSVDLRARVVAEVEGGASRREAAERYGLSASVVVIWMQRFATTGSVAAKPSGGSASPLEAHADFVLGLVAEKPDLTLNEIVAALRKRRIAGSRSARAFLARVGNGRRIGNYTAGQVVFSQGDPADAVFYIQKGKVKITAVSEQGKEAVVALLGPREFFGEGWSQFDGRTK
jgi:transposase